MPEQGNLAMQSGDRMPFANVQHDGGDSNGQRFDMDEIVERIIDKIEERVVDELERRGRRFSPGVF